MAVKRFSALQAFAGFLAFPSVAAATKDWMTGFPRTRIRVKAWPGGKRVAVCFIFYVETWGYGQGPDFRPDTVRRHPDYLNESFRQYAINWGVPRVGRVFSEEGLPLSIALNAEFLDKESAVWKAFRKYVPDAPIVAHGMNNSTDLLPLAAGLGAQENYIRKVLDLIEKGTGVRPRGWSSPSVYANAQTFTATAAAGMTYTLDGMDSDVLEELVTPSGKLTLIPYPTQAVDMGSYLQRYKEPDDLERLWIRYVTELATEAEADPNAYATVVAIGIHPFVVGTPNGAAALRGTLENLKTQKTVWVTDVEALMNAGKNV